jgi:hypothetical protein
VEGVPDYETLFGSLDLCACEHCRSVYSPAAYLVDILHFLQKRTTDDKTALQVLFERRGDLGEIELTCENTNTVLPYIDRSMRSSKARWRQRIRYTKRREPRKSYACTLNI